MDGGSSAPWSTTIGTYSISENQILFEEETMGFEGTSLSGHFVDNGRELIADVLKLMVGGGGLSAEYSEFYNITFTKTIQDILLDNDCAYGYDNNTNAWGVVGIFNKKSIVVRDDLKDFPVKYLWTSIRTDYDLNTISLPACIESIPDFFFYCPALISIVYRGTVAQWNAIHKEYNWNYENPVSYVQCSDGQVLL